MSPKPSTSSNPTKGRRLSASSIPAGAQNVESSSPKQPPSIDSLSSIMSSETMARFVKYRPWMFGRRQGSSLSLRRDLNASPVRGMGLEESDRDGSPVPLRSKPQVEGRTAVPLALPTGQNAVAPAQVSENEMSRNTNVDGVESELSTIRTNTVPSTASSARAGGGGVQNSPETVTAPTDAGSNLRLDSGVQRSSLPSHGDRDGIDDERVVRMAHYIAKSRRFEEFERLLNQPSSHEISARQIIQGISNPNASATADHLPVRRSPSQPIHTNQQLIGGLISHSSISRFSGPATVPPGALSSSFTNVPHQSVIKQPFQPITTSSSGPDNQPPLGAPSQGSIRLPPTLILSDLDNLPSLAIKFRDFALANSLENFVTGEATPDCLGRMYLFCKSNVVEARLDKRECPWPNGSGVSFNENGAKLWRPLISACRNGDLEFLLMHALAMATKAGLFRFEAFLTGIETFIWAVGNDLPISDVDEKAAALAFANFPAPLYQMCTSLQYRNVLEQCKLTLTSVGRGVPGLIMQSQLGRRMPHVMLFKQVLNIHSITLQRILRAKSVMSWWKGGLDQYYWLLDREFCCEQSEIAECLSHSQLSGPALAAACERISVKYHARYKAIVEAHDLSVRGVSAYQHGGFNAPLPNLQAANHQQRSLNIRPGMASHYPTPSVNRTPIMQAPSHPPPMLATLSQPVVRPPTAPVAKPKDFVLRSLETGKRLIAFVEELLMVQPIIWRSDFTNIQCEFVVPHRLLRTVPMISADPDASCQYSVCEGSHIFRIRCLKLPRERKHSSSLTKDAWFELENHLGWPDDLSAMTLNDLQKSSEGFHALEWRRAGPFAAKDRPIDITQTVRLGINSLRMVAKGPESGKVEQLPYAIAAESITYLLEDTVRQNIQNLTAAESLERLNKFLRANDESRDDDVSVISESVSIPMRDPISGSLATTPVRAEACRHLQCFDLGAFLASQSLERPDGFRCPLCGVDARPDKLRRDIWMAEVVKDLTSCNLADKVDSINVSKGGRYKVQQCQPRSGQRGTKRSHDDQEIQGSRPLRCSEPVIIEID